MAISSAYYKNILMKSSIDYVLILTIILSNSNTIFHISRWASTPTASAFAATRDKNMARQANTLQKASHVRYVDTYGTVKCSGPLHSPLHWFCKAKPLMVLAIAPVRGSRRSTLSQSTKSGKDVSSSRRDEYEKGFFFLSILTTSSGRQWKGDKPIQKSRGKVEEGPSKDKTPCQAKV